MEITDPKEIWAVAEHRWNKAYFTKPRAYKLAAIGIAWLLAIFITDAIVDHWAFVVFALPIVYLAFWMRGRNKDITALAEQMRRGKL